MISNTMQVVVWELPVSCMAQMLVLMDVRNLGYPWGHVSPSSYCCNVSAPLYV
jgi:hypothetical protein